MSVAIDKNLNEKNSETVWIWNIMWLLGDVKISKLNSQRKKNSSPTEYAPKVILSNDRKVNE